MVMAVQFSLDSSTSSLNLSSKNSNSLSSTVSNRTSKEVDSMFDKSKSNSKASNRKDHFKDVLNSSRKSKGKTEKANDSDKGTLVKELKDKIQELKEKAEENSSDEKEVNDILESLLNSLNKLLRLDDTSKVNLEEDSDIIYNSKNTESSSLLNQLLETLNSEEARNSIDSDTLVQMKGFLAQLNEDSKFSDKMKNGINDILSKLTDMIDEANNDSQKVLSLEDMLNNGYSKEQNSSLGDSDSEESGMFSSNKEDKFLNSLLDEKKDNSFDNKISMFSARSQAIQGQNTEVRGLTVNKATFTSDLIKDVKYMSVNNIKELTVKVNPGNLGEITIKIIQEDGLMKANLKANSKETTALLAQNLAEIKKELGEQNIKISEVNIELYNEDTTFFKDGNFGGALSQEQGRDERGASSRASSTIFSNIQDEEEITDNNAQIDAALDFLV